MLRWIVALLLAANLVWLAWAQGWLRPIGFGPQRQGEPERVAGQWKPEALRVDGASPTNASAAPAAPAAPAEAAPEGGGQTAPAPETSRGPDAQASHAPAAPDEADEAQPGHAPADVAPADAAPAAEPPGAPAPETPPAPAAKAPPSVCLQAGAFTEAQADALRRAAAALPAGSWQLHAVQLPSRWMVYTGKLASAEAAAARRRELNARGIDTDRPGAALEPGLSLGRFSSEDSANRAVADFARRGISGLRVVRERRDTPAYLLRLPAADAALREKLARPSLRQALAGKPLRPCD
ncbi:SPOR domain-containing protein [Ottowia massiliensis]|uniref:SPOR domain-containing protein n=1 Tax=Ottowia massiliensis TaxID=2045302 RepID=UPI000C83A362|nr:SPOR domain-containing protein [Ottowia massiliensis]